MISVVALLFLTFAGGTVYVYWKEAATLREANGLIAAGDFDEAMSLLRKSRRATYFHGNETEYLLASATVRQYALAAEPTTASNRLLRNATQQLKGLFQEGQEWQERAKLDLAEIIVIVPGAAPDGLTRCGALAGFLQELKLVEDKPLAQQLLTELESSNRRERRAG